MKFLFILFLLPIHLFAAKASDQNLESFFCYSKNKEMELEGVLKSGCGDPRYQRWQKNGCYHIKKRHARVNGAFEFEEFEMVRNLRFELEKRQGFFSMYTYDDKEWVLEGLAIELQASDGRDLSRMRFDQRQNKKQPFKSFYGFCRFN